MKDHVANVAACLDAIAVPLATDRLNTLGLDGSGAYGFYEVRLHRGTIFSDYELALAAALLGWPDVPTTVHEIGGGFGGLSMLLAALGFKASSIEIDPKRFYGAVALMKGLSQSCPAVGDNCQMILGRFPMSPGELPSAGAIAVITNLICTTTVDAKAEIIDALRPYSFSIIDIDRFLTRATSPEERATRIQDFELAGLVGEPFLNLGTSACLYRFAGA